MVRKILVSSALAMALAMVYFSSPVAAEEEENARVVPHLHCPKAGLCPYVKRIIPDFIYHAPVHAHSPAAVPHYPPLHHLFPLPVVPHPSSAHSAHPPSIIVHTNPHHASPHPPTPAPGHGDGHHPPAHHVSRRDAPVHPHAPHHIEASLCGNLCVNDNVCPGDKKCCPTECGYSCFDPVHIAE